MTRLRIVRAVVFAAACSLASSPLGAQNLGPFRQFLGLEGSYDRLQLDGGNGPRIGLNGYGLRLWVNLAPFSGPKPNLIDKTSLALFYFRTPARDFAIATRHYGAEFNIYPLLVPIGNVIDPFFSLGLGAFRVDNRRTAGSAPLPGGSTSVDIATGSATRFALSPGLGIRIPIPNRLQLRFDARDVIGLNTRTASGKSRTSHSGQFTGSVGLTF